MLGSWYTPREIGKRAMVFWLAGSIGQMFSGFLQAAAVSDSFSSPFRLADNDLWLLRPLHIQNQGAFRAERWHCEDSGFCQKRKVLECDVDLTENPTVYKLEWRGRISWLALALYQ